MKSSSSSASKPRGWFPNCCCCPGFWNPKSPRLDTFLLLPNNDDQDDKKFRSGDIFYDCQEYEYKEDHNEEPIGLKYSRKDEFQEDLNYVISCLTEEELEVAARTSYHYLKSAQKHDRKKHAIAMARRYLISKKKVPKAIQCMKDTLQFRLTIGIDGLREAFDGSVHDKETTPNTITSTTTNSTNMNKNGAACAKKLAYMLSSKKNYVMGYDKDGRGTYIFVPRCSREHDMEWTLKESLYTMERALACTEAHTNDDSNSIATINAVIDFSGFDIRRHAPPFFVGKEFLLMLRKHYVGCFNKIFILDAPFGFALLWNIFSPFVGTSTRTKIVFLNKHQKDEVLRNYYTPNQAARWMLVGGTKNRALDLDEYLYATPFDQAFDE